MTNSHMIAETVRRHCNQDCDGSLFCSRQWSALAARNLVELFDRIDRLSHAFLTGLESYWARSVRRKPIAMYLKGNSEVLSKNGFAAVGTRHPTPYATGIAKRLTCDLAARGLAITSGMARGIETAAHRGALNAHGLTAAVWRTRIDVTYPKENQKLA